MAKGHTLAIYAENNIGKQCLNPSQKYITFVLTPTRKA